MTFPLLGLLAVVAHAATPDEVLRRVAAADHYREARAARGAPALSEAERARVAEGSVVAGLASSGEAASKAYGAALIDVSIGVLWSALNDETRQPGYTAVTYSELLVGRPCERGRKVLQFLPVPMVSDRWWIGMPVANTALQRDSGGSVRELTWTSSTDASLVTSESGRNMIALGSPIGSSTGAWFLVAVDARSTWAEYFVVSDPGGRIPASLASRFATSGVRDNIEAIVRFAKEGNPSCPVQ